jgi:hypothetical protein
MRHCATKPRLRRRRRRLLEHFYGALPESLGRFERGLVVGDPFKVGALGMTPPAATRIANRLRSIEAIVCLVDEYADRKKGGWRVAMPESPSKSVNCQTDALPTFLMCCYLWLTCYLCER